MSQPRNLRPDQLNSESQPQPRWSGVDRENWITSALAAATRSLRQERLQAEKLITRDGVASND